MVRAAPQLIELYYCCTFCKSIQKVQLDSHNNARRHQVWHVWLAQNRSHAAIDVRRMRLVTQQYASRFTRHFSHSISTTTALNTIYEQATHSTSILKATQILRSIGVFDFGCIRYKNRNLSELQYLYIHPVPACDHLHEAVVICTGYGNKPGTAVRSKHISSGVMIYDL